MRAILQKLLSGARSTSRASYALLALLIALLAATVVLAVMGWNLADGANISPAGYFAMALGIVFSLVVGVGLMALVFYSSRAGYDEPARLIGSNVDHVASDGGRH